MTCNTRTASNTIPDIVAFVEHHDGGIADKVVRPRKS